MKSLIKNFSLPLLISFAVIIFINYKQQNVMQNKLPTIVKDTIWLTKDSLMNCNLYDYEYHKWIKLTNGKYEILNFDPENYLVIVTDLKDNFIYVDLNKDGVKDALGFTYTTYGGSGYFVNMQAFLNENGSAKHVASALLGDRILIDSVKIVQDKINLYLVVQGPNDGMCCPSQKVKWQYIFINNRFLKINKE
ncbi:MAG: hypothetical protein ACOYU5_12460 [Stygiobacter sp.]